MSFTTRLIGKTLLNAAGYAAGGAMYGAIGAKILQDAGNVGYSVLEATGLGLQEMQSLGQVLA